jgi:hypothetical protein
MVTGVKGFLYDSPCEWILRQSVRIDTCLSTTSLQVASTDRVISNRLTEASRRRRLSLRSFVIRGRPLPFLRLSEPPCWNDCRVTSTKSSDNFAKR